MQMPDVMLIGRTLIKYICDAKYMQMCKSVAGGRRLNIYIYVTGKLNGRR